MFTLILAIIVFSIWWFRKDLKRFFISRIHEMERSAALQNTRNETVSHNPSLLTKDQIDQLSIIRSRFSLSYARQFPVIRITGREMTNVVPESGIFTAKIKYKRENINLVVMLSTMTAVQEFEKLCYSCGTLSSYYWAQGYILPTPPDRCYSILLVTKFVLCGQTIIF